MGKVERYFSKNVAFNAFVHILLGGGLGILMTYPLVQTHPIRWAGLLIILAFLGYFYASKSGKK